LKIKVVKARIFYLKSRFMDRRNSSKSMVLTALAVPQIIISSPSDHVIHSVFKEDIKALIRFNGLAVVLKKTILIVNQGIRLAFTNLPLKKCMCRILFYRIMV